MELGVNDYLGVVKIGSQFGLRKKDNRMMFLELKEVLDAQDALALF
jgi:hypothetical protein